MTGAVAGLVSEAPHDHRRVVPVTLHHAGAAVHEGVPVGVVVADGVLVGVALEVGLVHHVEAQLVAERVEGGVVGVVRRPNGVDVVEPHQPQVVQHVLDGHGFARVGVMVVAVHAEDADRETVHQQLPVAHLHPAQPDPLRLALDDTPAGIHQLGGEGVEPGRLRAPRFGPGKVPSRVRFGPAPASARPRVRPMLAGLLDALEGHRCIDLAAHPGAGGIVQFEPHRPALR